MQLLDKAKDLLSDSKIYWKKPPLGRYINYRSIFSYSVGGIGVYSIIFLYTTINLSSTNVILSNLTGIPPLQLMAMYYVTFVISLLFTGVRAKMIDGIRLKKGKYRPYILYMGIPTAVLSCMAVWVPFEHISSYALKVVLCFAVNLALQFTYGFFYEAYENLVLVMSPNSQERSDVIAVKSIVYSFAPTVLNPLIPMLVKWLGAEDIYDIRIYRALFPPTAIFGIILTILVYVYTEEKIVQAKTHVVQVRFTDALRSVAKNKYFWIISMAGWIGFLEGNAGYILGWLYTYAKMCTDGEYAIITIIYGNASLWGMLAAPFAIKKFGKKWVLIFTNVMNIIFLAGLYPAIDTFNSIWIVLLCFYMNAVVGSFSHVLTPSINGDIRDYQHYISGERIDGMFSAVGIIGSFISLLTGTVTPLIFDRFGINEHNGYENAFDILKNEPDTLYSLIYLLIFLSIIGAALNVIPYFFYDLTELKQKGIVRVLKIRALFEDYGNGALNDGELTEAVELVRTSREYAAKEPLELSKAQMKAVRGNKTALKEARKEYEETKNYNDEIELGKMVVNEMNKFSSAAVQEQLKDARKIFAAGIDGIYDVPADVLTIARALPKTTPEEKTIRKNAVELAHVRLRGKKCANKYFPDGISEYDTSILTSLYEKEDAIADKLQSLFVERDVAQKNDAALYQKLCAEIRELKAEKQELEKQHRLETKKSALHSRALKAYEDSKKLIEQQKNYDHFESIEQLYDDAKVRHEAKLAADAEEEARLALLKAEEKAARKAAAASKRK